MSSLLVPRVFPDVQTPVAGSHLLQSEQRLPQPWLERIRFALARQSLGERCVELTHLIDEGIAYHSKVHLRPPSPSH